MPAIDLVNLSALLDDAKCFAFVRQHRWPEGVRCPCCDSGAVIRDGCDDTQRYRQRYRCKACAGRFDGPHRHGAGRAPSAAAGVGVVPLLHGPEPLEPADRCGFRRMPATCSETMSATIPI